MVILIITIQFIFLYSSANSPGTVANFIAQENKTNTNTILTELKKWYVSYVSKYALW